MDALNRRDFLTFAAYGGGALFAPSLKGLVACVEPGRATIRGATAIHQAGLGQGGYGALQATGPELALPTGFTYVMLGVEGSKMSDGNLTPRAHDGMAAFALPNGNVRLVRNHEVRDPPANATLKGDPAKAYDPKGGGGTTSLEIRVNDDGTRELLRDFVSLSGTIVNCAGGLTPWGSWLTCEETTLGQSQGWTKDHGYVFEVPADAEEEVAAQPILPLGRFVHEAVAVDPATGIVYETEDRGAAGFYRFIPRERGNLGAGGRLQMLAVRDRPNYGTSRGQQIGSTLAVDWVDIEDPDPAAAESNAGAVFNQGRSKGGAIFSRLEGCWYGDGSVYFHATSGGDQGMGQVWQYRPGDDSDGGEGAEGALTLVFESPGADVLNHPDNITVSPRGGILMCEDGRGTQHLRGLTPDGHIFDFATNLVNNSEFAGACFSPDGRTLFVNIQWPGMTFAIWGPWEDGAL